MLGGSESRNALNGHPSAAEIRLQTERILASELFTRSERLSGFLRYIVENTLEGHESTLKEQVIAQDIFNRGQPFDSAADPIVRVEARRLRDKLREYYATVEDQPVLITIPKGAYVPSFERNPSLRQVALEMAPVGLPSSPQTRRRALVVACTFVVILAAAVVWYALHKEAPRTVRTRPLTSLPGIEGAPSLSPNGNFVVFAWSNGGPADLYIKAVDDESLRRLTETPENETAPVWSPDGREIAFIRGRRIYVTSALGGAERKIGEGATRLAWSADSKSVYSSAPCNGRDTFCIHRIVLDTLQIRQITNPPASMSDRDLSISPDGANIVVTRSERRGTGDLYVAPAIGGEPRRLTNRNRHIAGVAWAPDGRSLIYSVLESGGFRLRRIPVKGSTGEDEPLTGATEDADSPSIGGSIRGGLFRLAYVSRVQDVSLRLVEIKPSSPKKLLGIATPLADATISRDCGGAFSPDGQQFVFSSFRSGEGFFWVVRRDGSGLRALKSLNGMDEGRPGAWSPDGHRIVFDLTVNGNTDIYISDADSAQPVRLTTEPSMDSAASWSPDGQWIYFFSDRSGIPQIWKVSASGGPALRVTSGFGFEPRPSPDGQFIYYLTCFPWRPCQLKRVAVAGGPEAVVLDGVIAFSWSVTPSGIYFLAREADTDWLDVYDVETRKRTRLGALPFRPAGAGFCGFLSVSQDGRFLISNHVDRFESNLGLLEISP